MNSWVSLLPPLIAIAMAFATRQVLLALFSGLAAGVLILHGTDYTQYVDLLDKYLVGSVANADHVYIILFSLFISGSVSILYNNGGMKALIRPFVGYIKTKKHAQWGVLCSGLMLFFDDYANSLVVGNTMRPITDHHKISREKLAYLVDSTSAPVAAIALVTTWIGAEVAYINEAVVALDITQSAYTIFLKSLPFAFYPVLTLVFIALITWQEKDFGPMLTAEKTAFAKGEPSHETCEESTYQPPFYYGALPIFLLIVITFSCLMITGSDKDHQTLSEIMGNANSYVSLLWGSFSCLISTLIMTSIFSIKKLETLFEEMIEGFSNLLPAICVLVLAWALSEVISDLKTSDYLIGVMPSNFSGWILPALIFVVAAAISFATGSSWGTMAILYPLVIPLAYSVATIEVSDLVYACVASVLSGAVFGDHCSPISDTTILSSLASGCNHIAHVRTQIPYALTVGVVSVFCLSLSLFIPSLICLIIGVSVLFLVVRNFGKSSTQK